MNFLKTTTLAVSVIMAGSVASAASWDFATDADDFFDVEDYEGTFDQVYIGGSADGGDGISVSASALTHPSADTDIEPHAFMDSYSSGKPGGLGVCSSGFDGEMSDCATGNPDADNKGDDNLVFPEILVLSFSDRVWLEELFIRDANHNPETGSLIVATSLELDGDHPATVVLNIVDGHVTNGLDAGFSDIFYFTSAGTQPGQEIYLSALTANVPLPAAGWLLLGGLGGLAAMKRRKKA